MEEILRGATGAAVEDVQQRLLALGYSVDTCEIESKTYGLTTTKAVNKFRNDHVLKVGDTVDRETWETLVDATYKLGDRTLYLRMPNYHGADVEYLQSALNVLGFSCGAVDGYYGPVTEAGVKEFQANAGVFADGMAFQDTFDAIERLAHVWKTGKKPATHFFHDRGLVRTASVLENNAIALIGKDPIARNIVGRMWNIASATTEDSKLILADSASSVSDKVDITVILTTNPFDYEALPVEGMPVISGESIEEIASRLHTLCELSHEGIPQVIGVELLDSNHYDGTFTAKKAQATAIKFIDVLCNELAR